MPSALIQRTSASAPLMVSLSVRLQVDLKFPVLQGCPHDVFQMLLPEKLAADGIIIHGVAQPSSEFGGGFLEGLGPADHVGGGQGIVVDDVDAELHNGREPYAFGALQTPGGLIQSASVSALHWRRRPECRRCRQTAVPCIHGAERSDMMPP